MSADMQEAVQLVVLRQVAASGAMVPADVLRELPRADIRDIKRAVDILMSDGTLEVPDPRVSRWGTLRSAEVTAKGQARLG